MKKIFKNIQLLIEDKKYFFYVIPLIIYINLTLIDTTTTFFVEQLLPYKSVIKYICVFTIMLKILFCDIKYYTKSNYIKIIILFAIFVTSSIFSGNRAIIQYFVIILGSYNLDFNIIAKQVLIWECICVGIIVVLAILKIIPNRIFDRSNSDVKRYSIGFKYATYPALFVWYLTMLYLYVKTNKIKLFEYILLITINIIMYIVTNSRNELIFSFLIIFISIVYNKFKMNKTKKIVSYFAKYSIIIFTVISILCMVLYNPKNNIWKKMNTLASGRLRLSNECMKEYDIKLFGNKMEWIGLSEIYEGENEESDFFYVDNSYINILYNYGVIFLILVMYSYYYIITKEIEKENYFLISILLVIIMHSFIDPQLVKIAYNIFILLFVQIIFDKKQLKKCFNRRNEVNEQNS